MSIESEAIISVNGRVMGNLDDLVKQPTEEFKEAMRGVVERAMPPTQPISQELAFKSGFDYRQIDEQHRDEVKAAANSIKQLGRAMHSSRLAIGKHLIEVKGMLPYGQFCAWIDAEFQLSERTAQNIMNAARLYGDGRSEIIAVLSDTVLYMLAAPSTPEEARAEVEQAAAAGQKVTVEFAREMIQKRKPAPVDSAPIWQLEHEIRSWLNEKIGEGGTPDIDAVLDSIKSQTNDPVKSGSWLDLLDKAVTANGVAFRKSDMTQAINNVRDQRKQARRQANSKVVYLGSEVDQSVMKLLTLDMRSDTFKAALLTATEDQLVEALKRVPPTSDKERYLKIGNRRELLALAQDAAHVDELIEATMPSQATPLEQAIAEVTPVAETTKSTAPSYLPEPQRVEIDDPELRTAGFHVIKTVYGGAYPDDWLYRFWWTRYDGTSTGPQRGTLELAIEDARRAFAEFHAPAKSAPALSKQEIINRDLDAYDAEAKREMAEIVAERDAVAQPPAPDPIMPDDLAEAGFTFVRVGKGMWAVELDNLREPYVSNWCFDPMDAVEDARAYLATLAPSTPPAPTVMPDDLAAAGYTLIDTKPGPGWCWHKGSGKTYASGPSLEHNNGVAISPEAAIADARRHYERSGGKLPKVATEASSSTVTLIFDRAIAEALHAALLIQDVKRGMTPGQRSIAEKAFGKALGL